ncbi:MAG TPA: ClpXP protease specificity-enhancing factor SspB [Sphingomicrobium sp.]|nr:ClpXP protease specificity-enhancing factor SspB [Sphingomicrobium sp.]
MSDDAPPESLIPYDEIVQEALRDVVGRVLGEVERSGGLPGGHHFYITFKTRLPGVSIPKHLVERFPDEMTIVIQHRFWDLKVEDDAFGVGLSFGGVPSMLRVPFAAVTQFHDPAVEFSLTFQANAEADLQEEHEVPENDIPQGEARESGEAGEAGETADDGSNVVSVDFTRKK